MSLAILDLLCKSYHVVFVLTRNSREVPPKLLPHDAAIPLLGIYSKEFKAGSRRDTSALRFIEAPFTIVKTWKRPERPSTGEWIKKLWRIRTAEYHSARKKEAVLPFVTTWMNPKDVLLSKISLPHLGREVA